ncbi:transcriptional regulator family: Fungal Specific TF [Penicillium lagena]|uniref:transcriptional regulator family: Fungal Specific TF n=1 Tax=Penicillium lagena TaxID=94218 RepID=UPI00253FB5E3|nr:transcriptional regulator family: Fungal Specific TF [Penicillium lagena]KAJ5624098.1 transcriptional regulator family: Fungal Specific TF [Penicillium lagena]
MSSKGRKYMSKRNRACDSCRTRKAACRIDSEPPCYLCTLHRKECTFQHQTNRPRRTIGYSVNSSGIQDSGISPPEVQRMASPLHDSMAFDALMSIHNEQSDSHTPNGSRNMEGIFDGQLNSFSGGFDDRVWPPGFSPGNFGYPSPGLPSFPCDDDRSAENAQRVKSEVSLDCENSMSPLFLGISGDMDPFLLQQYRFDSSGNFHFKNLDIQSVNLGEFPTQFLLAQPSIFSVGREETGCNNLSTQQQTDSLEAIVPVEIGQCFVDLFEKIVLPQYPILSSSKRLDPMSSPPHLLASVYLLAEPFTKFHERLCIDLAYEKPSPKALYKIIKDTLAFEIHAPNISTIQTIFFLVIRPSPNPIVQDSSFRWTIFSTLVSCAHSLGLHLDPKSWRIPGWQISQRRRLSYCIYTVDKWLALSLGRPPLINSESWLVTTIELADQLGSGIDSHEWSTVMKRSELESLLDRVITQLYSPRAVQSLFTDFEKTFAITEPLLHDIASWHHQNNRNEMDRTLEMSYHYINLSIIRAVFRPFVQSSINSNQSAGTLAAREQARIRAQHSISAAVVFVHDLSHNDLETLWPSWAATAFSSICFQILLMASISSDTAEATSWASSLQQVRRDMRLKADVLPCLRLGLLRIDSIFWKGLDNVLKLEEHMKQTFL